MKYINHPPVTLFILQTIIVIVVSAIGFCLHSAAVAQSAVVGGAVAIIPQSLFGFLVFRKRGARNASLIARNFFVGEGLKLMMTSILFAWIWSSYDHLISGAVLIGFALTVLVGQLSLPLMLGGIKTQ